MGHATFFQLFARIVDHSTLSFAEIARRTNENAQETVLVHCLPVNRATVLRIYRGEDCPRDPLLLYRIARFGLAQTDPQCKVLEQLRREEKLTHTTSHRTVVKATKVPDTDELPPLPKNLQRIKQA